MPTKTTWKKSNFENPEWRTAAIFKIVISPYLSEKNGPILIKFGIADIAPNDSHITKN